MVVCCLDAFDPIPDEVETRPKVEAKPAPVVEKAPVQKLETKTAEESESESEDEESVADLEEILVSVTLPPGVAAGQKIEVRSPDGRRTVDTVVPRGLKAGQTFIVRFPPSSKEPVTLQSVPVAPVNETVETTREAPKEKPAAVEPHGDAPRQSPPAVPEQKSFMDILEDMITPDPDPDVVLQMKQEQSKREQEKQELEAKANQSPLPEAVGKERKKKKKAKAGRAKALKSPASVEAREDSDTEGNNGELAEQSDDSGLHQSPSGGKRQDRLSLVRSLEDFLTPLSDSREDEPDSSKTLPPPSAAARANKYSPRGAAGDRRPFSLQDIRDRRLDHRAPSTSTFRSTSFMPSTGQKLVQVEVPPGLPPGSTIFVEIPGENRTVAAQVPPDVTSFHVAYMPQTYGTRIQRPTQAPAVVVPKPQAGREKLLSVRVPPGTPPGTTLHVSVPDEPGRILAAQVPPGNVSKFHVSYVPSEHMAPAHRSMLPPANAYQQPPSPSRPYGAGARDPPMLNQSSSGGGWNESRGYAGGRGESWEGYDF